MEGVQNADPSFTQLLIGIHAVWKLKVSYLLVSELTRDLQHNFLYTA